MQGSRPAESSGGARGGATRSNRLLWATLAALIAGALVGTMLGQIAADGTRAAVIAASDAVAQVFLRLLRMVVAPLVLGTIVAAVSGSREPIGRAGVAALLWFLVFSLVAIAIGLSLGNLFAPGAAFHLAASGPAPRIGAGTIDPAKLIEEMVPVSIVDAAAQNRILQIVVFAVFAGVAIRQLGDHGALLRTIAEQLAAAMARIAAIVIRAAPLAVFAATAKTVVQHGPASLALFARFVGVFYLGLGAMALLIGLAGAAVLGRRMGALVRTLREPLLIAFATASSEATLPTVIAALRAVGVSERATGLVLPLGYAFNLDGTLVYSACAVLFIAQAYGIPLGFHEQAALLLFLLVANKGAAGVSRGALVGLTLTLQTFGFPMEGLTLILGVEAVLDMGRTTLNVFGNAVAAAAIDRLVPGRPSDGVSDSPDGSRSGSGGRSGHHTSP